MALGFRLAETTKRLKRLEFYIQSPRLQTYFPIWISQNLVVRMRAFLSSLHVSTSILTSCLDGILG